VLKTILAVLPLALCFTPQLDAQSAVFDDQFDNNILADGWQLTFNPWGLWQVDELNSSYQVLDYGSTFGGNNEVISLNRTFAPVNGEFILTSSVNWNDNFWVPAGYSHLVYEINLFSANSEVIKFRINDQTATDGGNAFVQTASTNTPLPVTLPAAGQADIQLSRDANGVLGYSITINGVNYTNQISTDLSPIVYAEILIEHTTQGGPGRDMLAETYTGFIRLEEPSNNGPTLAVLNPVAGQTMQIEFSNATPNSTVGLGYSFTGAGPTNTSYGLVPLAPPFNRFPNAATNSNGFASWQQLIPAAALGRQCWFAGYDFASAQFTNGVAIVIQ
jgi:hypothetical protein